MFSAAGVGDGVRQEVEGLIVGVETPKGVGHIQGTVGGGGAWVHTADAMVGQLEGVGHIQGTVGGDGAWVHTADAKVGQVA